MLLSRNSCAITSASRRLLRSSSASTRIRSSRFYSRRGAMAAAPIRCAHVSVGYKELDAGLARLEQLPAPRYVLFTADPDPATGVSWCPDCVRSVPAVRRTMESEGAALLEVGVGQRADWKGNAAHPCRTDARFAVGGVPTLIHWTAAGAPGAKLGPELEAAASPAEAVALVAKFVAETRGA